MNYATSQDQGHPTPQGVHLVDMKDATPQDQGHLTPKGVHLVYIKNAPTPQDHGHPTPQGVYAYLDFQSFQLQTLQMGFY